MLCRVNTKPEKTKIAKVTELRKGDGGFLVEASTGQECLSALRGRSTDLTHR